MLRRPLAGLAAAALGRAPSDGMSGPRPVVLSGPSGAGKSTLLKRLLQEHGSIFGFSVSRVPRPSLVLIPRHDKGPEARRGERQRLLLCDQGGDAARHCCRRLHRACRVLRELVWDQQGRCAGRAGHEPHLRAGRGPAGRPQHQEDRPAAHLHLCAAALTGCPGAAAATAEHGDRGEPGQASGGGPGRHGEQQGARPVRPDHRQRQSGQGLLGPEGGALRGNKEGTSNWSVLMPAVSSQVGPRAWRPRQWARVSWQWLCSPQLTPRDWGAAHLPSPPTMIGGPCLLPPLPTSISRLPPHHALSTPYPWKPGQHPNKELLGWCP